MILSFSSDKADATVKKGQKQGHKPIARGCSKDDGRPRSEVGMGNKEQKGQGFCGYYDLDEVIVPPHVPKDGKIKEAETEKEQPCLPDVEEVLDVCRKEHPVE